MKTKKSAVAMFILSLLLSAACENRSSNGEVSSVASNIDESLEVVADGAGTSTKAGNCSALKEQVVIANNVLPGNIWDGQKLKMLKYDDDNDVVEFTIVKADSYNFRDCERKGKIKFGQWIVANFTGAGYICDQGESGNDGDDIVYKNVLKVLNRLKKDWVGIRLKINGRDDSSMTILLDETQTRQAIDEWKDIVDFDNMNEPAYE
jgi:hypothetical protein